VDHPYALQVYGDLTIDRGNNNASGNIDLSGGDINFYLNNNKNCLYSFQWRCLF
jgi:hypothetical protein